MEVTVFTLVCSGSVIEVYENEFGHGNAVYAGGRDRERRQGWSRGLASRHGAVEPRNRRADNFRAC